MTPEDAAALAQELDKAIAESRYGYQVAGEILRPNATAPERVALAAAFLFRPSQTGDGTEDPYVPMASFQTAGRPPDKLHEVPDDWCAIWQTIARQSTSPAVAAHLHDLLFARRYGRVGDQAEQAVEAFLAADYVELLPARSRAEALERALAIARLAGRQDLQARVIDALLRLAEGGTGPEDYKPGLVLGIVRILTDARCNDPRVDACIRETLRNGPPSPRVSEQLVGIERRRADSEEDRERLDRALVQIWLDHAEGQDPMVAVFHLEKAARIARDRGHADLHDEAVRKMHALAPITLPRISVEVPGEMSEEEIEQQINRLVGSWLCEAIGRVLASGPPCGRADWSRSLAAELAEEDSLGYLFPPVFQGADGLLRYRPTTPDERADAELVQIELRTMRFWGAMQVEAIRRAADRYCSTETEAINQLVDCGFPEDRAIAIGRLIQRLNENDLEGVVYVGLQTLERLTRELLLAVDEPLYRLQRDQSPASYPGLGAMLPGLAERGLDESWYRFLRALYTAPSGANYRNNALHGFEVGVGLLSAGLVLISIIFVAAQGPAEREGD